MERPGYGISTDQPGQRINDAVHDIRAFADHLGLERFAVIGWSAGGPPALATGARLADYDG